MLFFEIWAVLFPVTFIVLIKAGMGTFILSANPTQPSDLASDAKG